ncbi:hypothetical protein [Pelagibacterium sp.]|uniref:phage tail tip fiber protein n=1 Tax=Pelagibacterium sp. TaxID=1967288 RepID=UPI003A912291
MFDPISLLIRLVVGVVLYAASTLFDQAKKREQQKRTTGTRGSTQFGGRVPQYFLIGTVGEPGKQEYQDTWGNSGEVPNANLVDVISFGDMPISALSGLYVNGSKVTLATSGSDERGSPISEYNIGGNRLWWRFFDGTQTSASSYLTGKFGSDADRPWLSDMIGRGIPYLVMTALWDEKVWSGFPSYVGQFQGIKLYDPRKDSTAGGAGSHRWDNQSTWEFSDNNAVIIYNIERGIYYDGERIWGGDATALQLPYDVWAAAMDACDEAVSLQAGGTEKRFRGGRRIDLNERPADVIQDFLIGANARISHASDGTIYILVGVPDEADGAFSDTDVLGSEPLGSIPFPNLDDIINGATATYREPIQAWEGKETAPYYRADLEALDDGRRQADGLTLETTSSGTQAQRILQAVTEEGRRFRRHVVALPAPFAQFRPLQTLAWTSGRLGYDGKLFLITSRTRPIWGWVVVGLQEIDPADHNWTPATDERPINFAPITTNRPTPQEVSGFSVAPAIAVDTEGRQRRPAIDVFWSSASVAQDVNAVRITIALDDGGGEPGDIVWEGQAPRPELGAARIIQALLPIEAYVVQIEYEPLSGRETVASSWLPVTTPNVKLGPLDVIYGDLDLDELGQQMDGYLSWVAQSLREVIEEAQALALLAGDQEMANATQFDEMRRSLGTITSGLSATFDETITTAIVPINGQLVAIADAITEVSAGDGSDLATARFRMSAQSDEAGVTIGMQGRTGSEGDWRDAGAFLKVPNDDEEPTQFTVVADQFVITSGPNSLQPFVFEDGVAKMVAARIGTITAGQMLSDDEEFDVNLTEKYISIRLAD